MSNLTTSTGGFSNSFAEHPSIEATTNAVFLSKLYGIESLINKEELVEFVKKAHGQGREEGSFVVENVSDLQTVRNIILLYKYLDVDIPKKEIAQGLLTLLDGKQLDVRSNAQILQCLSLLDNPQDINSVKTTLRQHLQKHEKDGIFSFPDEKLSQLSANYYGLLLASLVDFTFDSKEKWATRILSFQSPSGGFYENADKKSVVLEATEQALSSLKILGALNRVDGEKVASYLQSLRILSLRSAYHAHLALALSGSLPNFFEMRVGFEVQDEEPLEENEDIVQGMKVRPVVTINTLNGIVHQGFQITATHKLNGQINKEKLTIDEAGNYLSNNWIETTSRLGLFNITFDAQHSPVGLGTTLNLQRTISKKIGFGIYVSAKAVFDITGKLIDVGETAPVGTKFSFVVSLYNKTQNRIVSGDFSVHFQVLDSSSHLIREDVNDCSNNKKMIEFNYVLESYSLPSGSLKFHFEVRDRSQRAHTTNTLTYRLSIPMVATAISFTGAADLHPTFKFGETVSLSMVLGSFPDMRTVYPYDKTYRIYLDIHSRSGTLIRSIPGSYSNSGKYIFEFLIEKNLDFLGRHVVSFRYVAADGENFPLSNYNTLTDEDIPELSFKVDGKLSLSLLSSQPTANDFYFGNEVVYRFRLRDLLSNSFLHSGRSSSQSNVFLSLRHHQLDGRKLAAVTVAAREEEENAFVLRWLVSSNTARGPATLVIYAMDVDGNVVDVSLDGQTAPYSVDVVVDGKIEARVADRTFSIAQQTAVLVDFSLVCRNKPLQGAILKAVVKNSEGVVVQKLLVGMHDNDYSLSWNIDSYQFYPPASFTLEVYREVDRLMEQKNRSQKEETESSSVPPLFSVPIYHSASSVQLPIRLEVVVFLVLLTGFAALFYKRFYYNQSFRY